MFVIFGNILKDIKLILLIFIYSIMKKAETRLTLLLVQENAEKGGTYERKEIVRIFE
jgi:hypothetical protein